MNKIVIVGHSLSGYQEVETLLNACGMASAQPSRREGFMPSQINATLCKAHSAAPLSQPGTPDQIQQLDVAPVWHGMALDLMLGNLDQAIWGWADPQAIYLLNYWRDLDPAITFILVYDRPHSVLTQASDQDAASLSPEALNQRTRNWDAYNAALLHFYHRNPQRCLLVHSQQVRESASSYLQQVRTRINAPWPESTAQLAAPQPSTATLSTATPSTAIQAVATPTALAPPALALFVADALVRQQPASLQLYQELQAAANLPLAQDADPTVQAQGALQAWQAMSAQSLQLQKQTQQIDRLQQAKTESDAHSIQQLAQLKAQLAKAKADATAAPKLDPEQAQENELLLAQLHHVQEELERYYLENQRLKAKPAAPAKSTPPALYGAADRIKQQLGYRLGSKMIERSRSLGGWLGMPFALMGVARQFKRELPQRKASKQIPIEQYRDAYEAVRMKQHLSYLLGAALVKHGKNPLRWPALPFALSKARQQWRSQQAQ